MPQKYTTNSINHLNILLSPFLTKIEHNKYFLTNWYDLLF